MQNLAGSCTVGLFRRRRARRCLEPRGGRTPPPRFPHKSFAGRRLRWLALYPERQMAMGALHAAPQPPSPEPTGAYVRPELDEDNAADTALDDIMNGVLEEMAAAHDEAPGAEAANEEQEEEEWDE